MAKRLRGKQCLVVLDDVWHETQPRPFSRFAGNGITVLLTSRRLPLVEAFGSTLLREPPKPLQQHAALRLIVLTSGRSHAELALETEDARALDDLVELCAGMPALLRSVGRMCASRSPLATWQFFLTHSESQRLPRTMARADGYQLEAAKGNLYLAIENQVDELEKADERLAARLTMLAVFADRGARRVAVPLRVLMGLWGEAPTLPLDEAEARETVERLAGESLVELSIEQALDEASTRSDSPLSHRGVQRPARRSPALPQRSERSGLSQRASRGSMRSDGRTVSLLEPVGEYLRCRRRILVENTHSRDKTTRDAGIKVCHRRSASNSATIFAAFTRNPYSQPSSQTLTFLPISDLHSFPRCTRGSCEAAMCVLSTITRAFGRRISSSTTFAAAPIVCGPVPFLPFTASTSRIPLVSRSATKLRAPRR